MSVPDALTCPVFLELVLITLPLAGPALLTLYRWIFVATALLP